MQVAEWKRDEVTKIKRLIDEHTVIGIVGMRGIPAKQLQSIRRELGDKALLMVHRNNLMRITFDEMDIKLGDFIEDQTALIFTQIDPFMLYKMLEKSKTPAPIKQGEIAPNDIIVEKGPTPFKPGPIVGELQHVGIPAGISGGKVMIEKTKIVAKEGEVVSGGLAEMLSRLQIYPKEVGLDLRAVKKDDLIYTREILAIDEDMYISDMNKAVEAAFGLAMHVTYATDETIHPLLRIAYINGYNLAVNVPIFEPSVMKDIIYRAYTHMTSLCALTKEVKMEYVYAALLLHSAGKEITEDGVCTVLRSAGMDVDVIKAKSLVSALDGVDIDEAISAQISPVPEVTKKEEKKEEMKEEEEEKEEEEAEISGMEGLGSLFG